MSVGFRKIVIALAVASTVVAAAGCAGSVKKAALSPVAVHGPLLSGQVQVVAYSKGNVRICPDTATLADFGPPQIPPCTNGPRAVGVKTSALTSRQKDKTARWGLLWLVGRYRSGTFYVTSQRLHGPARQPAGNSTFDTPPCPAPSGGWNVAPRTYTQMRALNHYSRVAHHHDIDSVAFFDHAAVLTVASADPARTRAILGPFWPRQLCVVKARYPRAVVARVRARMLHLLTVSPVSSPAAATYGWPTGAGGIGVSNGGQSTTSLSVLVVTPRLRALLRTLPRGVVVVDAALR